MSKLDSAYTVYKPWGKEIWMELNDKYCYKRIYINAGTKTSYQYHNNKLETNFIIEGTAEVWLENELGIIEKNIMKSGEYFTVVPPRKHRVIAITDLILQEVSTPEVDDVVRIADDTYRKDGKISYEHLKPALCILTAGIGSRLEHFSEHINKCLLPLDNKAIISHIIEKTPKDYEIIVSIGYKGEMVREYCLSAHPERNFKFVEVDNYVGENSGPAYSINQCREQLQRPFIWVAGDVVISENFPTLDGNWLGICPTSIPHLYSTVNIDTNIDNDNIIGFKNKSEDGYDYAFIGLAGVYDFEKFWEQLDIESGEIVSAYYDIDSYENMKGKKFEWYDIGTIDNYLKSKKVFEINSKQYSIPKTNGEFLYKLKNQFIKLSSDKNFIEGRIKRSDNLGKLIPQLNYRGKYLYSYYWIEGDTLYDCSNPRILDKFLNFAEKNLWKIFDVGIDESFKDICKNFYYTKTIDRLELFLDRRDESFSKEHNINGFEVNSIYELLNGFDWESLFDGIPTKLFHGDLQFDNVLYGNDEKFYLLDWRQDFAGSDVGDVYYDLSKMYGGIIMSYKLMKDENNFSCFVNGNVVSYSYSNDDNLNVFQPRYEKWILNQGYDLNRVKLITSLIFLNMAPLHEEVFGNLLFFKSKEMLQKINDK